MLLVGPLVGPSAFALAGCLGGLDASGASDTDGGAARATVLAEIDTNHFCDMVGVVDVVLRATAQACVAGDDACELPAPVDGTIFSCPAIDASSLLAVELQSPASYRIAAVARFTDGPQLEECFATSDAAPVFAVTEAEIDDAAQISAAPGHEACADN